MGKGHNNNIHAPQKSNIDKIRRAEQARRTTPDTDRKVTKDIYEQLFKACLRRKGGHMCAREDGEIPPPHSNIAFSTTPAVNL